jgi:hypothetical protein
MSYNVRVLKDSISNSKVRLTTLEVTLPRIILAEFNTHRVFSRNSASSRAIPVEKMLKRVKEDPFIPIYWGKNQKGMQAEQELIHDGMSEQEKKQVLAVLENTWLKARDEAVIQATELMNLGVHKQITNRLLEPFLWQTIIVTSTEWSNWDALRMHKDAQPEIRRAAIMMHEARKLSTPKLLGPDEWHLPLVPELEDDVFNTAPIEWSFWKKVASGRCARISHLTHDGLRDLQADINLASQLQASGHMSPFEHIARPMTDFEANTSGIFCGNFRGWVQYRKELPFENDYQAIQNSIEEIELNS